MEKKTKQTWHYA